MLSILRLEQLQFRKLGIAKLCTQLHPAHFSLYPILCNTLKVIRTKISNVIGKFSKIYPEKFKVVHFDWKLEHMVSWRCLFQIWSFLNLDFWNTDTKIHFWGYLGGKSRSCPFCLKTGTHGISRMLILIPTLVLWNSKPKSIFGQIWVIKSQSSPFFLKINAQSISRILILIPTLVFWMSNPNSTFGRIWAEKVKIVRFT